MGPQFGDLNLPIRYLAEFPKSPGDGGPWESHQIEEKKRF